MSELKNCPFCGSKASFVTDEYYYDKRRTTFTYFFHIHCSKCDATINQYELEFYLNKNGEIVFKKDMRSKAIEEWNRRA